MSAYGIGAAATEPVNGERPPRRLGQLLAAEAARARWRARIGARTRRVRCGLSSFGIRGRRRSRTLSSSSPPAVDAALPVVSTSEWWMPIARQAGRPPISPASEKRRTQSGRGRHYATSNSPRLGLAIRMRASPSGSRVLRGIRRPAEVAGGRASERSRREYPPRRRRRWLPPRPSRPGTVPRSGIAPDSRCLRCHHVP
jgi:hypothetical protein